MNISTYKTQAGSSTNSALSVIKVLSNMHRYAIMKLLLNTRKDLCVHELSAIVGISQSATSHQLAYLEARGAVKSARMGKAKCYTPQDSALTKKIAQVISSLQ